MRKLSVLALSGLFGMLAAAATPSTASAAPLGLASGTTHLAIADGQVEHVHKRKWRHHHRRHWRYGYYPRKYRYNRYGYYRPYYYGYYPYHRRRPGIYFGFRL